MGRRRFLVLNEGAFKSAVENLAVQRVRQLFEVNRVEGVEHQIAWLTTAQRLARAAETFIQKRLSSPEGQGKPGAETLRRPKRTG